MPDTGKLEEFDPALIQGCSLPVEKAWVDYNGHMNVAYYVLAFDRATDFFLDKVSLGEGYLKSQGGSTFTVEMNVSYIREVHLNDPLVFTTQLLGFDDKRIHYFHAMYHAEEGFLAATNECLGLHMDMSVRRVSPIPDVQRDALRAVASAQAHLPRPERVGRVMATK